MPFTDPVCFTDYFIDAINVDGQEYDKCDEYIPVLSRENFDEYATKLLESE